MGVSIEARRTARAQARTSIETGDGREPARRRLPGSILSLVRPLPQCPGAAGRGESGLDTYVYRSHVFPVRQPYDTGTTRCLQKPLECIMRCRLDHRAARPSRVYHERQAHSNKPPNDGVHIALGHCCCRDAFERGEPIGRGRRADAHGKCDGGGRQECCHPHGCSPYTALMAWDRARAFRATIVELEAGGVERVNHPNG